MHSGRCGRVGDGHCFAGGAAQRTETPERAGANAYSDTYYTATRTEDAVEAMLDEAERTALFDSEEELSPIEEVAQETQRRKAEKRTKFQEKQAAENKK